MLSNGSSINRKLLNNKDSIKSKITFSQSKFQVLNKQNDYKKVETKEEEIQIKDRSPLMYNRNKVNPPLKKKPTNEINILTNASEKPIEIQSQPLILQKNLENSLIEIEIKNDKLESEIRMLRKKLAEQEKIIKDKNTKITELEEQNLQLRLDSKKTKDKYYALKNNIRQQQIINEENQFDDFINPINNDYPQISRLQRISDMINSIRDVMVIPGEQDLIDELCPDPDNMTYEQLLELQEKIGYVNKGLSEEDIKKIPVISFSKNNTSKKNFSDYCTICQSDFSNGEKLKQLNCQHCYHPACVDQWLSDNKACPICKEDIKVK